MNEKDTPAAGGSDPEDERTIDARQERGDRGKLATKVAKAMAEAGEVTKSSTNTDQNYKYASVEAILEAVRGPLFAQGVILLQRPSTIVENEITARSGTKGSQVTVRIDFEFIDGETGAQLTIEDWAGQGIDYGDKAFGKAYTNAVKTFVRAQWLLPTGDDPEQDSPERGSRDGLPAWAAPANAQVKAKMVDALLPQFGGNRRAVQAYCKLLSDSIGAFPVIVADWLSHLQEHAAAAQQQVQQPAPEPEPEPTPAEKAEAAAKEADAETEAQRQEQDKAAEEPPTVDGSAEEIPMDPEPDPDGPPASGSLEPTEENIAEHCTCTRDDGGELVRDDACPIRDHGIPF